MWQIDHIVQYTNGWSCSQHDQDQQDTDDRTMRCANFVLKHNRKDQNRSNRLDETEIS
jgi:hypothetical protein